MPKKFSELFFRCIVISKNKLEKIELFGGIFHQIVNIETPFLQN